MRGEVRSEWRRDARFFTLDVTIPPNTTATVFISGTGPESISESGRPAGQAEGVRFLRSEGGAAVFAIGSGRYSFIAKLPGKFPGDAPQPHLGIPEAQAQSR